MDVRREVFWITTWARRLGWSLLVLCMAAGLAAPTPTSADAKRDRAGGLEVRSPNGALTASLTAVGAGCDESVVTIRTAGPAVVHSFTSPDCQNGYVVNQAQWTADSRFFIFNLQSSGGHQPMNQPLWRYDRTIGDIREVSLPGNVVPGAFRLRPHDHLALRVWNIDRQAEAGVEVDLRAER
ncbi:hypothetical protein [Phenylobacterium sp.]|uniref:hypothetical protein n=1 Tax=Phenylobacterium sp. TaxID=1871053 RepID=UPI001211F84E|nr:hypothetical protein [Phenylobacterium sp.]THD72255.1 MAG: hypothetical protein E8A12_00770 [Phenylobacterium sp.]